MSAYLPIVMMIVLGFLFAALSFVASGLLAPKRPTVAKLDPYECGIVPSKEPAERFPVKFYLVAMIFIIFDIEIVFLYPWAVVYKQLAGFGIVEMGVFALAVVVSFFYLLANGALEWGPGKRLRVATPLKESAERTLRSTIRKVSNLDKDSDAAA